MFKIALADKFRISLLAMSMALAGCGSREDLDGYLVVSVKTHPELAFEHLEGTRGCAALRVRDTPATRTFRNGQTEEYTINTVIGPVDVCK